MAKYLSSMDEAISPSSEHQKKLRVSFIKYLKVLQEAYSFSLDTMCATIQVFDQFHRVRPFHSDRKEEQLSSLGIIMVSIKFNEVYPLTLEQIYDTLGM